jgi:hypothetical protein
VEQKIAKQLKDSTKKLCRQLQKKPAVEGNQQQVKRHKGELIKTTKEAIDEMENDLTIFNFTRIIKDQMNESDRYEQLKD